MDLNSGLQYPDVNAGNVGLTSTSTVQHNADHTQLTNSVTTNTCSQVENELENESLAKLQDLPETFVKAKESNKDEKEMEKEVHENTTAPKDELVCISDTVERRIQPVRASTNIKELQVKLVPREVEERQDMENALLRQTRDTNVEVSTIQINSESIRDSEENFVVLESKPNIQEKQVNIVGASFSEVDERDTSGLGILLQPSKTNVHTKKRVHGIITEKEEGQSSDRDFVQPPEANLTFSEILVNPIHEINTERDDLPEINNVNLFQASELHPDLHDILTEVKERQFMVNDHILQQSALDIKAPNMNDEITSKTEERKNPDNDNVFQILNKMQNEKRYK